jgi:hypothetical protein
MPATGPDGLHKASWQQLKARAELEQRPHERQEEKILIVRRQTKRRKALVYLQQEAKIIHSEQDNDKREPDAAVGTGSLDENWCVCVAVLMCHHCLLTSSFGRRLMQIE